MLPGCVLLLLRVFCWFFFFPFHHFLPMEDHRITYIRKVLRRSLGPKSCSQQDWLQSQTWFLMALDVSHLLSFTCGLQVARKEGKRSNLSCVGWKVSKENKIIHDPQQSLFIEHSLPLASMSNCLFTWHFHGFIKLI